MFFVKSYFFKIGYHSNLEFECKRESSFIHRLIVYRTGIKSAVTLATGNAIFDPTIGIFKLIVETKVQTKSK